MLRQIRKLLNPKKKPPQVDRGTELRTKFPDFSEETLEVVLSVEPYTMTSPERIEALCNAVHHISTSKIGGDIVECGVWRGGSMMAIAHCLQQQEDTHRKLHLYDTFEGMPPAQEVDRDFTNTSADKLLEVQEKLDPQSIWCYSGIDEVKKNMAATCYPDNLIRLVPGRVEETLAFDLPDQIALLRLDTDWYESTKVSLEQLYPRLVPGGVLIIDDYGHWQGCRKAVDDYFYKTDQKILLQRIDYTGRIGIKTVLNPSTLQSISA
ncbi:MAG: TylF/MycF/NovP-related O-methyltransferase [Planctomycetota bacterium]|nr:TylF/MycF/NovP-related O-methyltransferase [Planctomycetota bacterium]